MSFIWCFYRILASRVVRIDFPTLQCQASSQCNPPPLTWRLEHLSKLNEFSETPSGQHRQVLPHLLLLSTTGLHTTNHNVPETPKWNKTSTCASLAKPWPKRNHPHAPRARNTFSSVTIASPWTRAADTSAASSVQHKIILRARCIHRAGIRSASSSGPPLLLQQRILASTLLEASLSRTDASWITTRAPAEGTREWSAMWPR